MMAAGDPPIAVLFDAYRQSGLYADLSAGIVTPGSMAAFLARHEVEQARGAGLSTTTPVYLNGLGSPWTRPAIRPDQTRDMMRWAMGRVERTITVDVCAMPGYPTGI